MARYTDIDLLIDKIEGTDWYHISKQGELVLGANSKDHVPLYKHSDITDALNNAPLADVAPKSEVAYWMDAAANAKKEAIKEFAERLKKYYGNLNSNTAAGLVEYHIEQIKEEMLCEK